MSAPLDPLVRFGAFELDLRTGELRKGGVRINLPDQPFQVLKTLLDRPGELVTREELRQRLWSAETFVDFEHGLNAAVRRLRDALGDSADVPRFVETLPRRGYRFIAPVIQPPATEDGAVPSRGTESKSEALPTPDRDAGAAELTRARVLGVDRGDGAGGSRCPLGVRLPAPGPRRLLSPLPTSGRFMLAVLPFENLTGDPDQEYIG